MGEFRLPDTWGGRGYKRMNTIDILRAWVQAEIQAAITHDTDSIVSAKKEADRIFNALIEKLAED